MWQLAEGSAPLSPYPWYRRISEQHVSVDASPEGAKIEADKLVQTHICGGTHNE